MDNEGQQVRTGTTDQPQIMPERRSAPKTAMLNKDGELLWTSAAWNSDLSPEFGQEGQSIHDRWPATWVAAFQAFVDSSRIEENVLITGDDAGAQHHARAHMFRMGHSQESDRFLIQVTSSGVRNWPSRNTSGVEGDSSSQRAEVSRDQARYKTSARLGRSQVYRFVSSHVAEVLGDVCLIRTPDSTGQYLELRAIAVDDGMEQLTKWPRLRAPSSIAEGVSGAVFQSGTTLRLRSPELPEHLNASARSSLQALYDNGLQSILVLPLLGHSGRLGTIGVLRFRAGRSYSDRDEEFLQGFADLAAMALEGADREHELRQSASYK